MPRIRLQSTAQRAFVILLATPRSNKIKTQIKRTLETNLRQPQPKALPKIIMQGWPNRHVKNSPNLPKMWYALLQGMYDGRP